MKGYTSTCHLLNKRFSPPLDGLDVIYKVDSSENSLLLCKIYAIIRQILREAKKRVTVKKFQTESAQTTNLVSVNYDCKFNFKQNKFAVLAVSKDGSTVRLEFAYYVPRTFNRTVLPYCHPCF